jgi:hypothetical protein
LGHFPTSSFADAAAGQNGQNTEVGTRFLCLLRKFFIFYTLISLYGEKAILPNLYNRVGGISPK